MTAAAAPAPWRPAAGLGRFLLIVGEVALLAMLMRTFRIESPAFYRRIVPLVAAGFVMHHFLPRAWRQPFFVALSMGGIAWVFGWIGGAWLVGIGLVLIGAAHAPLPWIGRALLVALVGGVLAALRAGVAAPPWPAAIWSILGSMFCFRMLVYLYDLKHAREPMGVARTLAYFFLLPNIVFPLFPVVDFATFKRTWYDRDALAIYQRGVQWIARGLTHLILYRLVYQRFTLSPADVVSAATLLQYLLANFFLYLRVSGQFHLIVGLLHLFGWRLPATHRFFYLSSSFTDFWRRINIYWKDFTQKLFFQPTFYPLRKRLGDRGALVVATLVVFFATWVLHSWQWFWLLGTWLFSATDTAFWGILGVVLVGGVLRESKQGRVRTLAGGARSWRGSVPVGFRTALTFTVLCLLWAMWTSPTFTSFAVLFSGITWDAAGLATLGAAGLVLVGVGIVGHRLDTGIGETEAPVIRGTLRAALPLVLALAAIQPRIAERLPVGVQETLRDLQLAELNRRDQATLQRGYYEQIVGVNRFNGQLWEVLSARAGDPRGRGANFWSTGATVRVDDERYRALKPLQGLMYRGASVRTNRWGMRDQDYPQLPAPGTVRVAVLGSSFVMGDGVADGENFESLVEQRFAAEQPLGPGRRVEFLNFALGEYSPYAQVVLLRNGRVASFKPDIVLFVGHPYDLRPINLMLPVYYGRRLTLDTLRWAVRTAGIDSTMPREEAERRIHPYVEPLMHWAYLTIAAEARRIGARPVYAYVPTPRHEAIGADPALLTAWAREAGFTVIDLTDLWHGEAVEQYVLASWDFHPNVRGHERIAARLYDELRRRPELFTPR